MAEDPYLWTCDQVKQFFRTEAVTLLQDRPHSSLPDTEKFIEALADNEVTGATLLEDVDSSSLKDDFGVSKLGVRGSVVHCIRKLRSRSAAYNRQHGPVGTSDAESTSASSTDVGASNSVQMPVAPTPNTQISDANQAPTQRTPATDQNISEFVDEQGRKRRRLNLVQPVDNATSPPSANKATTETTVSGYLGDEAFTVEAFFFGDTGFGHEIAEHPSHEVIQLSTDQESDDDNFQVLYPIATAGQAAFAAAQMRHFLANPQRLDFARGDRSAIAILPYRESLQLKARSALVLHFPSGQQEPVATRELAAYVDRGDVYNEPGAEPMNESAADEIEMLDLKYGDEDDEILPAWDESERERPMSVSPEDTDDEDPEVAAVNNRLLPDERVVEIINEVIQEYIDAWNPKLPELEKTRAWTVWKKTKQRHSIRNGLIQAAKGYIDTLNRRISKMIDELRSTEWQSERSLIKSCENMELSIQEREEQKWMIAVWWRTQEPTHTVKHGTGKHRTGQTSNSHQQGTARQDDLVLPDDKFAVTPAVPQTNPDDMLIDATSPRTEETYDPAELIAQAEDEDQEMADAEPDNEPVDFADGLPEASDNAADDSPDTVVADPDLGEDARIGTGASDSNAKASEESGSAYQPSAANGGGFGSSADEPVTPRRRRESQRQVIDLSNLSDSAGPSSSPIPPSRKNRKATGLANRTPREPADPFHADAAAVASWDVYKAAANNDRIRMLIKLFSTLPAELRERIHKHNRESGRSKFVSSLLTSTQALKDGTFDPRSCELQLRCVRLHAAVVLPTPVLVALAMEPSIEAEFPKLTTQEWGSVINRTQAELSVTMMGKILNLKEKLFATPNTSTTAKSTSKTSRKVKIPDMAEIVVISDGDTPSKSRHHVSQVRETPRKRRKREVQMSKFGDQSRKNALERQKKYEEVVEAQTAGSADPGASIRTDVNGVSVLKIEINPARTENEEPIYIIDQIAEKLKTHQIEGIRFLWREITASGNDEESHGCILAHTMGLGKTMQVLALLAAVAGTVESSNAKIYRQLPNELRPRGGRRLRFLVLCPPSLIQNWRREIDRWLPKNICNVFSLEANQGAWRERYVDEWAQAGGILVLGYNIFRSLIEPPGVYAHELPPIAEHLLSDADIVVADEAHYLKNQTASTTKAASRIKTKFRIGLSGTPLSNNVQEIYALVSWVAPGYLGEPVEFRANYMEPIQEGLYEQSTHYERRKSIMKLKVLHHEIGPKVNRATIEVLRGSLKPKIEFVITVPLTRNQATLYRRFINAVLRERRNEGVGNGQIFGWLSLLTLLTNHPRCFQRKLLEPPKKSKSKAGQGSSVVDAAGNASVNLFHLAASQANAVDTAEQQTNTSSEDPNRAPGDEHVSALGLTPLVVQKILEGVNSEFDLDPLLSSKVTVFTQLLFSCLECKDKVLVFSTSIPTLQYLNEYLNHCEIPFGRIDGKVPIEQRMQIIEDFHKDKFHVLLISTRAGALGLNIQGANRVFIFDFSFNPAWEEQAIGRAYRIGQPKPVYVYRFVAGGTFEHNIYNTQLFKSSLAQRVVDKKKPRRSAERSPGEWLYEPTPVQQMDLAKWIGKDEHVLNRLIEQHSPGSGIDTMIREICTMETLQEEALDAPLDPEEEQMVKKEIAEGMGRRTRSRAQIAAGTSAGGGGKDAVGRPAIRRDGSTSEA